MKICYSSGRSGRSAYTGPDKKQNIFDIFLTNRPSTITSCEVIPGISDHEIVSISTSVVISHNKNTAKNVFLWHKVNFDSIRHHITEFSTTFLEVYHHNNPVDVLWNNYKALCKDCLAMIPQTKSVKQKLPWITRNIKRLSREKKRK